MPPPLREWVRFAGKADADPAAPSGGQQRRKAIVPALALDPEILLFDERTSALDPEMISDVLGVMSALAADGRTMMVVTRGVGFEKRAADRVLFVDKGSILDDCTKDRFFTDVDDGPVAPATTSTRSWRIDDPATLAETMTDTLSTIDTPAAVIDVPRMQHNIARMQRRVDELGVAFRPHVKTSKCSVVVAAQRAAGARGITVSTLKEAEHFLADGVTDILYAVCMAPHRLPHAADLRRRGCDLKIITDSLTGAQAIVDFGRAHGATFEVWIEIDTDGHRSGIEPDDADLPTLGRLLHDGGMRLGGVMTHAAASYDLDTPDALAALAEQERAGCVRAAERLRAAGLPCPVVSVGSTPTALSARHLDGVTEVRTGVYVFFDLVMSNVGVCDVDDIALGVLTTVIGHQLDRGWAIVDAGWMAMSRDRGTGKQKHDYGYGQVCAIDGAPLAGYVLGGANQEHGIVSRAGVPDADIAARFPVGSRLRILPNHACATGAQFPEYHALAADGTLATWRRFHGW